jgi:hypothetical protein
MIVLQILAGEYLMLVVLAILFALLSQSELRKGIRRVDRMNYFREDNRKGILWLWGITTGIGGIYTLLAIIWMSPRFWESVALSGSVAL